MTNDTVKRGIRKSLKEMGIDIDNIQFLNVKKNGNHVESLGNIILTLNNIDGIRIDSLKSIVNKYLDSINISYTGMLLDV